MKEIIPTFVFSLCFALSLYGQAEKTTSTDASMKNKTHFEIPEGFAFVCPPCGCAEDQAHQDRPGSCSGCGMTMVATIKNAPRRAAPSPEERAAARKKVGIFVFDGVQIIDFTGPYEVFGQAGMEVFTVAQSAEPIRTGMNMQVVPNYSFDNCPDLDIVVLPGGGVGRHQRNEAVMKWVKKQAAATETTLSVCNGAFFLAEAGLLDGKRATTFASLIPSLERLAPKATIVRDERFVDNGKIVTSAGLSSGIDGALHVVSEYLGVGRTQEIATNLEYDWDPEGDYVRAALADNLLRGARDLLRQFEHETLRFEGTNDYWQSQYLVKTQVGADKLTDLIAMQLSSVEKWRKQDGKGGSSTWRLQGNDHRTWLGKVAVEASENRPDEIYVTYWVGKEK